MTAVVLTALLAATGAAPTAIEDLSRSFEGQRGTFVLLDPATGRTVRFDAARAAVRFPPCSTFKIPNALIGLETGVLSGPDHRMAWDGERRDVPEWNRDQTLRSAIANSVVWYFQRVASGIGEPRMREWLARLHYGNEDISGGLTRFWLMSSLAISADEQVEFVRRLVASELPFSERSMRTVRELLFLRATERGKLHGKTGSGVRAGGGGLGWFVGWVETPAGVRVFALNVEGPGARGVDARRIAERILTEKGLL